MKKDPGIRLAAFNGLSKQLDIHGDVLPRELCAITAHITGMLHEGWLNNILKEKGEIILLKNQILMQ